MGVTRLNVQSPMSKVQGPAARVNLIFDVALEF